MNGTILTTEETQLECDHEEADTRIIYHLARMDDDHKTVLVRSSDTDVQLVLLSNMCNLPSNVTIYLQTGTAGSKRIVNVSALHNELGKELSRALTAFHMFTGCDHTPAFFRKGKVTPYKTPYKILTRDPRFVKAFANLANESVIDQQTQDALEEFTCKMYGVKKSKTVNEARYELFCKSYMPKKSNEPVLKFEKSFSSNSIPPSQTELMEQIKRAHFLGGLWSNAHLKFGDVTKANNNGWLVTSENVEIIWFTGEMAPRMDEISRNEVKNDDNDDDDDQERNITYSDDSSTDEEGEEEE